MPSPNWTLHVEGFGPIRKAELDVRPLTLLVGENSTGKSYLATLLWGLAQTNRVSPFPKSPVQEPVYELLDKLLKENSHQLTLSRNNLEQIFTLTNSLLSRIKHYFIARLFNSPLIGANSVSIHLSPGPFDANPQTISLIARVEVHPRAFLSQLQFSTTLNHGLGLGGDFRAKYLPASRTGFMLTYPYVVSRGIEGLLSDVEEVGDPAAVSRTRLTRPTIEFLKLLATGTDEGSHFLSEAQALEESLGGEIVKHSQAGFNQYEYRMKGAETNLPMSIVSTMVSELAPIITVLKSSDKIPFLVIEEPEAHLHPKVQRTLAVVIARLIRKGVRVVLTTHGDLFCHQLNNLIKLGSLPEPKRRALQKRFKLKETDYLLPQEVSGYGLTISKDRTHSVVEALKMTPYGLEMPTFNAEIDSLEAQTDALDQAIEALQ